MILTSINKKTQSTNALKFMIQFNGRNYNMIHYQTIQIINYIFIKNFNNSKIGIKNRLYQISLQPIFLYIPPLIYSWFG